MATLCCQGRAEGLGWGLSAHSKNPLSPMPTPKNKKQEGGSNYVKKRKEKRKRTAKNKQKNNGWRLPCREKFEEAE